MRTLSNQPRLRRAIDRAQPLLRSLHRLQVYLMAQRRHGHQHKLLKLALQLTVNGVASGLRNTG